MERGLINITTATTTKLMDFSDTQTRIRSISLTNWGALIAGVDVYIEDTAGNKSYYLSTYMPGKTTIVLDDVTFDNRLLKLVCVTTGTTPKISVIIRS